MSSSKLISTRRSTVLSHPFLLDIHGKTSPYEVVIALFHQLASLVNKKKEKNDLIGISNIRVGIYKNSYEKLKKKMLFHRNPT